MQITLQQTDKLLRGNYRFSQLGFSMLITRLKGLYAKDPSQDVLYKAVNEINAFLEKFQSVMANDYAVIAQL